ncbi:MAG: GNAT family N-acetyltransferase [Defluviitaleaceae bacterium]|nr:GNAT family N-acetyltransferase [Defluviitaleaceae bacterium]
MNLYSALQQVLPQYNIVTLTLDNYTETREVFETNREFLIEGYGKLIDELGVAEAILKLPDGFKSDDKHLMVICQNGQAIAAVDLLANVPVQGELYLSFLVVHGDMKGKGIGANVSEGIMQAARLAGFTKIGLGSFDDTANFWRKQGYEQEAKHDGFWIFYRRCD